MSDNVLKFRRPSLQPPAADRTITVSLPHFLYVLDSFIQTAQVAYDKLTQLEEVQRLRPANDEVGVRKMQNQNREDRRALTQMVVDLRAMRAEAEQQTD